MESVTALVLTYRYWILIPLSVIEGPIVAFVAGTLAAAGVLDLYVLAVLFFVTDMGKDAFYYALGHFGTRTALAGRLLSQVGVTEDHFDEVRRVWERHPLRTMFFGKLAYGVATGFIVLAGAIRMRLTTFFASGAIVAIFQYWLLLALGYFFGSALGGSIENIFKNIQYALAGITIVTIVYYIVVHRIRRRATAKNLVEDIEKRG